MKTQQVTSGQNFPRIDDASGTWTAAISVIIGIAGHILFLSALFVFLYIWPLDSLLRGDAYAALLSTTLVSTLTVIAVLGPIVLYVARRKGVANFWSSIEWNANPSIIRYFVIGAAVAILYCLTLRIAFGSAGSFLASPHALDLWLYGAVVVLLQPAIEEVYFRGILFAGLERRFRSLPAIVVVTVVFACLHPRHWLYVLPVAIALGAARIKSRSVAACFALHASYNLFLAVYQIVFPS